MYYLILSLSLKPMSSDIDLKFDPVNKNFTPGFHEEKDYRTSSIYRVRSPFLTR